MISIIRHVLQLPPSLDEDETRIARLLRVILVATLILNPLYSIGLLLLDTASNLALWLNTLIFIVEIASFIQMKRGFVRSASILLTVSWWLYFSFVNLTFGGSQSPAIVGYFLLILVAGLLLGGSSAIGFSILCVATGGLLLYVELEGNLPTLFEPPGPAYTWLSFMIATVIMAVLLRLATGSLSQALQNARYNASALAKNNKELESVQRILERRVEELKATEAALRFSEERLRTVVSSAPILIWGANQDGQITVAQGETLAEFGFSSERFVGTSIFRYEKTLPGISEYVSRAIQGEDVTSVQKVDQRTLEMRYTPLQNDVEEIIGVIGIVIDITERVEAEAAMQQAQKLESLGVLAGGIAHDFNNLLVAMMAQNSVAMAKLDAGNPAYGNIDKAFRAAERAAELTRQMLAYAGRGRFDMGQIQLNELVAENLNLLRVSIAKNVLLKSQFFEELPFVYGDSGQLQQVVMNLIINAADAIGDKSGEVMVKTQLSDIPAQPDIEYWRNVTPDLAAGEYVIVEVTDTGSGMDYETVSRIFDPFFSTKENGRGLGLAAVLGIVRSHGGDLWVHSKVGEGTTFCLLLPQLEEEQLEEKAGTGELVFVPSPNGHGSVVLVIDDEEPVLEAVTDILALDGIEVMTAPGGEIGLETYQKNKAKITLVLLDLSMPGMNGEETFQALREFDPTVRVVLSSGYDEREAKGRFADTGLADFLQKPYDIDSLTKKVRQYL
ncbi:MAG: response regulator [Chloroflexota bacterium]